MLNKLFSKGNKDRELRKHLSQMLHFKPKNVALYRIAITHSSCFSSDGSLPNNERLEFLGDAYLGSIVGEYLYLLYPKEDEGFLTEMRSKIVSRVQLDKLAVDIGLDKLVNYNKGDESLRHNKHIYGNALEALVGAIYLDKGFNTTRSFILNVLLKGYVDIRELELTEVNFKKGIYTWAQKEHKELDFKVLSEESLGRRKVFTVGVFVDGELFEKGTGWNKKAAAQSAAEQALKSLEK